MITIPSQSADEPGAGRATANEVKKGFEARGETITSWAAARGYKRESVYAILAGRTKGRRGQAHVIAVQLGIKPEPT